MTGFKPGSSGIGSNHSANCATTTAQLINFPSPDWYSLVGGCDPEVAEPTRHDLLNVTAVLTLFTDGSKQRIFTLGGCITGQLVSGLTKERNVLIFVCTKLLKCKPVKLEPNYLSDISTQLRCVFSDQRISQMNEGLLCKVGKYSPGRFQTLIGLQLLRIISFAVNIKTPRIYLFG